MKTVRWTLTLLLIILGIAKGVYAEEDAARVPQILGTWLVQGDFNDGNGPFQVLVTFMPGRNFNEGTLVDTNEFQLTGNPVCTPDQGTWQRLPGNKYIATHLTFCFDVKKKNSPDGIAKVRDSIEMKGSNEFNGRQHVEAFDPGGKLVFTGDVTMHGVRVKAEAPPQ